MKQAYHVRMHASRHLRCVAPPRSRTAAFSWMVVIGLAFALAPRVTTAASTQAVPTAPAIAVPCDPATDALLERIEAASAEIRTLTGRLRYDRRQPVLGDEQRRFGELRYEAGPPARFAVHFNRLVYDGTAVRQNQHWIFDGRWLLERDEQERSATRRQIAAESADDTSGPMLGLGESPFVLPLNHRKADILARFEVNLLPPDADDPENTHHLQLIPRQPDAQGVTRIDLWYDQESLLIRRAFSREAGGEESIFELMQPRINIELPDRHFDTRLPTGRGWSAREIPLEPATP